jgi:hypothetical protein
MRENEGYPTGFGDFAGNFPEMPGISQKQPLFTCINADLAVQSGLNVKKFTKRKAK